MNFIDNDKMNFDENCIPFQKGFFFDSTIGRLFVIYSQVKYIYHSLDSGKKVVYLASGEELFEK
jgi:hypothetical protein